MKNLAKLALFFSLCFALLFLAAVLLRYLASWIDMVRIIPLGSEPGEDAAALAWAALPVAIYLSILLGLSYTVRRKIPIPLAIACISVLACLFTAGVSLGVSRADALKFALKPAPSIPARPGLILSQSDNVIVLLKESSDVRGPRAVSIPGRPLIYQDVPRGPNNTILPLPALPFGTEAPWFIRSLGIDLSLSARQMENRLAESFYSFAVYAFSLILLLASLRFIFELSQWPLANLFLGALVFRLVLILETFINSREMTELIDSFLNGFVPSMLITPLVFGAFAALIILYTLLTRLARIGTSPQEGSYE
jgi:hypothetical protein